MTTGQSETIHWSSRNSRIDGSSSETGTTISGATNVAISAGGDLTARAANLSAGNDLSLDAAGQIVLYAGQNQTYAQTEQSQRKGMSYSSLEASSSETTLARTTLSADNVKLHSGGDTTLGAIQVDANTLDIQAEGQLNLLTQTTTSSKSVNKSSGDAAFVSARTKGHIDETTNYNQFNVASVNLQAGGGIQANVAKGTDLQILAQQPGMAWVNQLISDPALVNSTSWKTVEEAHKKWQTDQSGLGPVSSAIVMLVVAVATAGAGASAVGSATGMSATSAAAAYPTMTAAIQAGITSLASQATISTFNNGGNLGKVFDELTSSESLKNLATAMVTAGALQGLSTSGLLPANLASATNGTATWADQLQRQLIDNTAAAVIRSGINGTSLGDELQQGIVTAFLNTAAAQGANWIGDNGPQGNQSLNAFAAETAHALVGCGIGAARAGGANGCAPGALGAMAGHLASSAMPNLNPDQVLAVSQLIGGLAGALTGQVSEGVYIGAGAAGNAVANNRLLHPSEGEVAQRLVEKAQREGLPYTLEEIEAQMRLMGNALYGVEPNHAEVYANTAGDTTAFEALQGSLAQDPTMPRGVNGGTVFEILGTPNAAIQSFVTASTRDGAGYIPGISPYMPSNTGYGAASGNPPSISTAPCANMNLGCASGVGVQQNVPLTEAQRQSAAEYIGQAATNYQRIAFLSASAGRGDVALVYEIAALSANFLEQSLKPSTGKVTTDAALDYAIQQTAQRTGIPRSVLLEISEQQVKPMIQPFIVWIDSHVTAKK